MAGIVIQPGLEIPETELQFETARSGGPGGQNVNKVETKVVLRFDVLRSSTLDDRMRRRIAEKLATRIGKDGVLRVASQRHRSQAQNRQASIERFAELLRAALHRDPPRRPTRPSRSAKEKRLSAKKRRADSKRQRSARDHD